MTARVKELVESGIFTYIDSVPEKHVRYNAAINIPVFLSEICGLSSHIILCRFLF